MEIAVQDRSWRLLVLVLALLAGAAMAFFATRRLWADHLNHSRRSEDWLRAAQLEPANGEYWYHLAFHREWDFADADAALAVNYYRKALECDPRSSRYWLGLGSTYEQQGDSIRARGAYENAVAAYPVSAQVRWDYGNYLLRQGLIDAGFRQIHAALAANPALTGLAISRCWHARPNASALLDQVLPESSTAYIATLGFFGAQRETEAAGKIWDRMVARRTPFALKDLFPYLDALIEQDHIAEAQGVWLQAFGLLGLPAESQPPSVIWNGGFEHGLAGGGFGWKQQNAPGVTFAFDTAVLHSGARSMRIEFGGGFNTDFLHLGQLVPVEPGRSYHFRAFMKTDSITTESGMLFVLTDTKTGHQALTAALTGTHDWIPLEAELTTGPQTRLAGIVLRRFPSRLFDNKISGTVWIDDVTLTPLPNAGQAKAFASPARAAAQP